LHANRKRRTCLHIPATLTQVDALSTERPLRADAARNRARILTAAREVFAARGLDVTLDDIARHAGLGTGTVYRRFASRQELVEALFEERIREITAVAERCAEDEDPWRGFETLVRSACAQLADDRGLRQVMASSTHGLDRVQSARDALHPLVEAVVERAQRAGGLRADLRAQDVPVLFLVVGTVADFGGAGAPELWERYLSFLLDGLRHVPGRELSPLGAALPPALTDPQLAASMSCFRPVGRRSPASA
jgi:AcrR family transcriptional regulator